MTQERLQKALAHAGVASRRAVEEMIREGRITIDGRVAKLGDRVDLETESVKIDGRRITPAHGRRHYILLNKPVGFVSTTRDPEGRSTVLDLVPQRLRKGLVPVGRLDYASEGLLILTDDGDFAHHVAHPRYGCWKTYEVKVKGHPGEAALEKLRQGMVLDGKRTAPADVRPRGGHMGPRNSVENSWWTVVLSEGRTRQIREMFYRVGHPVARLRRVAVGPISDSYLTPGAWRELTEAEVELLRRKTARRRPVARPRRAGPKSAAGGAKAAGGRKSAGKPAGGKTAGAKSPARKKAPPSPKGPPKGRRGGPGSRSGTARPARRRPRHD